MKNRRRINVEVSKADIWTDSSNVSNVPHNSHLLPRFALRRGECLLRARTDHVRSGGLRICSIWWSCTNGPKLTSSGLSRCCGCNPHCRHSLQLQNAVIGELTECGLFGPWFNVRQGPLPRTVQ